MGWSGGANTVRGSELTEEGKRGEEDKEVGEKEGKEEEGKEEEGKKGGGTKER